MSDTYIRQDQFIQFALRFQFNVCGVLLFAAPEFAPPKFPTAEMVRLRAPFRDFATERHVQNLTAEPSSSILSQFWKNDQSTLIRGTHRTRHKFPSSESHTCYRTVSEWVPSQPFSQSKKTDAACSSAPGRQNGDDTHYDTKNHLNYRTHYEV